MYYWLKSALYLVGCCLAYWSHMVVKFPDEKDFIIITLASYGVLLAIYYYTTYILERFAFFICS